MQTIAAEVAMANEQEIKELARKRVQNRIGFWSHLVFYAVVNAGLIVIWSITGRGYPWFAWPLVCWGAAVVVHAFTLQVGPGSVGEERAVEREVRRLQARSEAH
jgi:hypothetical protein